jgi:hypothetical protein
MTFGCAAHCARPRGTLRFGCPGGAGVWPGRCSMSERSEDDAGIGNGGASNLRRRKVEGWRPDCSNRTAILNPVVAPQRVIQITGQKKQSGHFPDFSPRIFRRPTRDTPSRSRRERLEFWRDALIRQRHLAGWTL